MTRLAQSKGCLSSRRPGSTILGLGSILDETDDDTLPNSPISLPNRRFDDTAARTAARVMRIIEFFSEVRRPVRASEIGSALALPRSTTHDLLHTLVDTGFVTFNENTKRYFLSPRLAGIGERLSSFYFGNGTLSSVIQSLALKSGENVAISVPEAHFMRVVAVAKGAPHRLSTGEGSLLPMLDSASGCAFLTTQSDHNIVEIIRHISRRRSSDNDSGLHEFLELIRGFRIQGYAVVQAAIDLIAVAAPIYCEEADVQLVISVGGPIERLERNIPELADLLIDAVRSVDQGFSVMADENDGGRE